MHQAIHLGWLAALHGLSTQIEDWAAAVYAFVKMYGLQETVMTLDDLSGGDDVRGTGMPVGHRRAHSWSGAMCGLHRRLRALLDDMSGGGRCAWDRCASEIQKGMMRGSGGSCGAKDDFAHFGTTCQGATMCAGQVRQWGCALAPTRCHNAKG